MSITRSSVAGVIALGVALLAGWSTGAGARQGAADAVRIDANDLGGVVTSVRGPEAGVWVIAETKDLPTGFRKIVVTDDRGRYVVPDLPKASYSVWVRGYGLVDSPKVQAMPGAMLNLSAVIAPDARAAAQYYPGNYWLSLYEMPPASEFPGTGPQGNGIPVAMKTQAQFVGNLKGACNACHVIGPKATREIPASLGVFDSSLAAWKRRTQSGQYGGGMSNAFTRLGPRADAAFASWTDRIAAGEVPPAPPRPQGVERNVVISSWDWASQYSFIHDIVATDKRNPTLNAYGPVYGADRHNAPDISSVDPMTNTASRPVSVPVLDKSTPFSTLQDMAAPSPYWGEDLIWSNRASTHNPMIDDRGRLWMTATIRPYDNPAYCKAGSSHPSAKVFPIGSSERQLAMYDPKTKKVEVISTCYATHHLWFAADQDNTLWTASIDQPYVGWLNTRMWDQTHDAAKSQGWFPFVIDTNGNRKLDAFVGPNDPIDPIRDKQIKSGSYGLMPSPVDGSIWSVPSGTPGMLVRISPESGLSEVYDPPLPGHTTRGVDLDRNGLVWVTLQSGHFASFDRRKCKVFNGPTATGQHCREGWTLYQTPGPNFKNVTDSGSADFHYANYVDQFDTFGLGANVPIATGTNSDALLALQPGGKWVVVRIPYPMNQNMRGMDGRIDDPKAGWKGRGLWSTYSSQAPWHYEGGKGTTSKAVHVQLRPDPLAK